MDSKRAGSRMVATKGRERRGGRGWSAGAMLQLDRNIKLVFYYSGGVNVIHNTASYTKVRR
jgi:hypothetical protein